ncbi:MAG: hypothetical protein ACR2NI_04475 [Pirellulales bacterium]
MEQYYHEPEGTPPSVIVLCEYSGRVRDAFLDYGWDAFSCDLLPCESDVYDGRHYQMDAIDALRTRPFWDLVIMHPPCTALAVSGNAHYGVGRPKESMRKEAIEWTTKLWSEACQHSSSVCLENPVGVLGDWIGKPAQYIQPWQFGHPESKRTGLWLYGLDPLVPTDILKKPACGYWDNQTPSGQNKLGPSPDRAKIRSLTYQGIANAMANQWGQW